MKLNAQPQVADFFVIAGTYVTFHRDAAIRLKKKLYAVSVYASPQDLPMPAPMLARAAVSSPVAVTGGDTSCHFFFWHVENHHIHGGYFHGREIDFII